MDKPSTFNISDESFNYCNKLIEEGEFDNISDIVNYSMHIFYDYIRIKGVQSKLLKRSNPQKKSIRVNETVLDGLINTGFFSVSELADYSIAFLVEWRSNFSTRGVKVD